MASVTIKVEILLAAVWTDITAYTRTEETISITRGRQDEQSGPTPARCVLKLTNDGRFSPRNPSGAYYGSIGRNTQLRVSVLDDAAVYKIRFWGEVTDWPVDWDPSESNVTVSVTASGIRRRLGLLPKPAQSPYRQAMASVSPLIGYWPMEDTTGSSFFASAVPYVPQASYGGTVTLASDTTFVASKPLPVFGTPSSFFAATVPNYTPSVTGQQVRMLAKATATGAGNFVLYVGTTGDYFFQFFSDPATNSARLDCFDRATGLLQASTGGFSIAGQPITGGIRLSIELKQNGVSVEFNATGIPPGASTGFSLGVTSIVGTLGRVNYVRGHGDVDVTFVAGHVAVENHITSIFDLEEVLDAYAGELAYDRASRIAGIMGAPVSLIGTASTTALMGAQLDASLLALFDEAATVDDGLSTETVDTFGLQFRARTDMYTKTEVLQLAYTDLAALQPTDDDQQLVNDVTVVRVGGSSVTQTATGALAVSAVGDYAQTYTLSLFADAQLADQAGWRLSQGTVDAPRWPVCGFNARKLTSGQRDQLVALREGDRIRVTGLPVFSGTPGTAYQIVNGWRELITPHSWELVLNTHPASGFDVVLLDNAAAGRLDSDTSTLSANATSVATTISVASGETWTTTDVPFGITVSGEEMTATAVAATASPQVFTVTRSVNGVVKAHVTGESVRLTTPYRLGM